MRFVCAGDLHLGSGADLSKDGADGSLAEQEAVLAQIIDAANELDAPLLWVGDAWEHRRPAPAEVLVIRRQFARLKQRALIIPGNHDVEAFGRPTGYDLLASAPIIVATPQVIGGDGYQIACLPWAQASRLVDLEDDRDRVHERLAEGLLEIARGLYAAMEVDGPKILVGHWSISGASTPSGIPTDQFQEPVIPLAELEQIGFDAIVFGHIHKPQTLQGISSRPIFYVGSPMALNFGETGSEHGAWLLDFAGTHGEAYLIALDSPRLVTIDAEFVEEFVAYPLDDVAGCVVKLPDSGDRGGGPPARPRRRARGAVRPRSPPGVVGRGDHRTRRARPRPSGRGGHRRPRRARAVARLVRPARPDPSTPRPAQRLPGEPPMNPRRLKLRNLRSFVELDLALPDGRIAIIGKNGAGKSTLATSIDWALFGPDGRSFASYLTQGSAETEMLLELAFEHAGREYRVRRTFSSRGSTKTTLELHVLDETVLEMHPLTRETVKQTQEFIETILGLTRETFRASSMLVQGDGAAFTEAQPRDRKQILARILGLERWDLYLTACRHDIREREHAVEHLGRQLGDAEEEIAQRADVEEAIETSRAIVEESERLGKEAAANFAAADETIRATAQNDAAQSARDRRGDPGGDATRGAPGEADDRRRGAQGAHGRSRGTRHADDRRPDPGGGGGSRARAGRPARACDRTGARRQQEP